MRADYEGRLKKSSVTLPFPEIEYAETEETADSLSQRITKTGRIQVSKKAWIVRV